MANDSTGSDVREFAEDEEKFIQLLEILEGNYTPIKENTVYVEAVVDTRQDYGWLL